MLQRFTEHDISDFMWAASYLDCPLPAEFLEAIADVTLARLDSFSARSAAAVMASFANLEHDPLEGRLKRAVTRKLDADRRAEAEAAALLHA